MDNTSIIEQAKKESIEIIELSEIILKNKNLEIAEAIHFTVGKTVLKESIKNPWIYVYTKMELTNLPLDEVVTNYGNLTSRGLKNTIEFKKELELR